MSIVAKMVLTSLVETRDQQYLGSGSTGKGEYAMNESVRIEMAGVQSEPFGKYTPDASFKAFIRSTAASRFFSNLWRAYIRDENPQAQAPQLYVLMMTPAEYEQFMNGGRDLARAEREA